MIDIINRSISSMSTIYFAIFIVYFHLIRGENGGKHEPHFLSTMINSSVPVGRDASLVCHVSESHGFKVAWVRVETQTILTMNEHVITRNHRIKVSNPEKAEWRLDIADVKRRDAGYYMCQVNTDPMKSQLGYLEVVEPPAILAAGTSEDQTVEEGRNVVLSCRAGGHPAPQVRWKREDGKKIRKSDGSTSDTLVGHLISLLSVSREDMGAYLCIAQNGVPPAVSRRIILEVTYPPTVVLDKESVLARVGSSVMFGCTAESFPNPVTSWATGNNMAITQGGRYGIIKEERKGFVDTSLIIKNIGLKDDQTRFKCSGQNSIGAAEKSVILHVKDDLPKIKEDIKIKEEIIYTDRSRENHPTVEIFEIEQIKITEQNRNNNRAKGRNRNKPGRESEYNKKQNSDYEKYDGQTDQNSWKNSNRYLSSNSKNIHLQQKYFYFCLFLNFCILGIVLRW